MRDDGHGDCELCGLRRICFPGRIAAEGRSSQRQLRIRRARITRGTALYRMGDRVESFHMVRSGCIKEIGGSSGAADSIVNFCVPGELLTVQAARSARSQTTTIAVETSFICGVPWRIFHQVCAATPEVAGEFIDLVAKAGASTRELLSMIRAKGALERVAGFLLNLRGRMQFRAFSERQFRLGMSRDDIANYLGLRSETVSRCFSELARRELVEVRAKRVQIMNPQELRRVYSGETAAVLE